ncbi:membrane protein of unknown function [Modestobacter italicus]|uniref:Uncharacterized protein n=1 Tax=Modestobacter italicus (strain DSM 44449 / CECT 9708 / BC 501) TaxID=2732864 RepID=I4F3D0_MODI5|nr:membrane protein of unknown function [Modestobacter marinus]
MCDGAVVSAPVQQLPARSRPGRLWPTVGACTLLTVGAVLAGTAVSAGRRPAPEDSLVPGPLPAEVLWLLLAVTVVGVVVAVLATGWSVPLAWRSRAGVAWLVVLVLGAVAGVIDAAGVAINAPLASGPPIPVFHWLFTFLPAVFGAVVSRAPSGRGRCAAALGTGVVTLPLLAMTWALSGVGPAPDRLADVVWLTVPLGVVPLAIAALMAGGMGPGKSPEAEPPKA